MVLYSFRSPLKLGRSRLESLNCSWTRCTTLGKLYIFHEPKPCFFKVEKIIEPLKTKSEPEAEPESTIYLRKLFPLEAGEMSAWLDYMCRSTLQLSEAIEYVWK